jgi:hypothetical protein
VGIKERLAAVEAKLGIEQPQADSGILAWDGKDRMDGFTFPAREIDDDDKVKNFEHFCYLTPEIVAAIKALPEADE